MAIYISSGNLPRTEDCMRPAIACNAGSPESLRTSHSLLNTSSSCGDAARVFSTASSRQADFLNWGCAGSTVYFVFRCYTDQAIGVQESVARFSDECILRSKIP